MTNTRRSFLGGLSGVAAGLAYSPLAAQTTDELKPLFADASGSEKYWSLVGGQFPLRSGKVPMNAANLCPSPRVVSERVAELLRDKTPTFNEGTEATLTRSHTTSRLY